MQSVLVQPLAEFPLIKQHQKPVVYVSQTNRFGAVVVVVNSARRTGSALTTLPSAVIAHLGHALAFCLCAFARPGLSLSSFHAPGM
jgi:hypothetical protein